ncbi:MAG TPA: hypothetical protein DCS35_11020 [Vibrio sp.]|nr:hypothetical protein [Vibrio sp.]
MEISGNIIHSKGVNARKKLNKFVVKRQSSPYNPSAISNPNAAKLTKLAALIMRNDEVGFPFLPFY